mmetsp:Transcript_41601/g.89310  ORF Transcript_41601/g.89310 Transcript_41601/m.89310 type:complete len:214 (+) Transcript_41601:2143-2784(+)
MLARKENDEPRIRGAFAIHSQHSASAALGSSTSPKTPIDTRLPEAGAAPRPVISASPASSPPATGLPEAEAWDVERPRRAPNSTSMGPGSRPLAAAPVAVAMALRPLLPACRAAAAAVPATGAAGAGAGTAAAKGAAVVWTGGRLTPAWECRPSPSGVAATRRSSSVTCMERLVPASARLLLAKLLVSSASSSQLDGSIIPAYAMGGELCMNT